MRNWRGKRWGGSLLWNKLGGRWRNGDRALPRRLLSVSPDLRLEVGKQNFHLFHTISPILWILSSELRLYWSAIGIQCRLWGPFFGDAVVALLFFLPSIPLAFIMLDATLITDWMRPTKRHIPPSFLFYTICWNLPGLRVGVDYGGGSVRVGYKRVSEAPLQGRKVGDACK